MRGVFYLRIFEFQKDWYRRFFHGALKFYEKFESFTIGEIADEIRAKVGGDRNLTFRKAEQADDSREDLFVTEESGRSVFDVKLLIQSGAIRSSFFGSICKMEK